MQQCGFCSALTEVFRRLMCIGGSRRGSGESCYQELDNEETRRGGISIDRTENGLFIRMLDPGPFPPAKKKHLSQSDWLLLETLDLRCKRPLHTGRFLTMHKRRRKRLITRSLTQNHALLDDIHHGQVQCVLDRVNQWPFNAFILDNVTGGRSLPVLCVHLFHWYGVLDYFKLDVVRCWKFFSLIEEGYHSTNPYHNSIHATDVTQAMHCFLQVKKIRKYLTPLEIMASIIAAVTHDLDHPGVNQPFLIATSNHLAALYENSSVLENHHWRSAIGCLLESHVAEEIEDCRPELQRQISSLILATDITRQQEFLTRFKSYLDQDELDMKSEEHRHFILQIALKCADISNPCRPWEVSKKWSQKVCEEFFRQGDYERQLNLPVTALCDRQSTTVPKIQAGFFTYVVYPLFEEWHRFLRDDLSDDMMRNLHGNKIKWDALIKQENEAKAAEEAAVTEEDTTVLSDAPGSDLLREPDKNPNFLMVPEWDCQQKIGRRHSVPLSLHSGNGGGGGGGLEIPKTIIRRESLPVPEKRYSLACRSGLLEEEDENSVNSDRSISFISSASDELRDKDDSREEKILSSENLLPEPSITSITTVSEASRLSNVFGRRPSNQQSAHKSQLTRQQTFPPLQPYVRHRYLSTTVEMSRCINIDTNSSSKSDTSSIGGGGEAPNCGTKHGCKTPPPSKTIVLRESNRSSFGHNDQDKKNGSKRETSGSSHERGVKMAKLWDEKLIIECHEKENLDPRKCGLDVELEGSLIQVGSRRNSSQSQLSRRRGSAPVGSELNNPMALALRGWNERFPRRGSVPSDAIRCYAEDGFGLRVTQEHSLSYSNQQHCPYPRPGSVSVDLSRPDGGKQRIFNKKILRRRSSGGPEMFCLGKNENESILWKVDVLSKKHGGESNVNVSTDSMTTRRRGSLPLDVLLATHSGDHRDTQGS